MSDRTKIWAAMDRRSFITGATATAAIAGLGSCGRTQEAKEQNGLLTVEVAQWGQEKYLIYLPFYIAQEAGLFERNGVKTNTRFSGNDDQTFTSVLRGDAHVGIGDPIFAAIARDRGGKGVVLGQLVGKVALWGVSKSVTSRLVNPSDFAGLTIGTFPRPSTNYTLMRNMLDENAVEGARIAEVPIGSEVALLESGAADVVMMLEPAASNAEASGFRVVTSFPDLWGPYAFTGLTSTDDTVSQNKEAISGLLAGISEALTLAHEDRSEAKRIATKLFPDLSSAVVDSAVERMITDGTLPKSVQVSPESWSAAVKVRKEMGELTGSTDYAEVIVN